MSHLPRVKQASPRQSQDSNPDSANHRAGTPPHCGVPARSPTSSVRHLSPPLGILSSAEGEGLVSACLPDSPLPARGWARTGVSGVGPTGEQPQGQVESLGSGLQGGHAPGQLGLIPEPGCVCSKPAAVIRHKQLRSGLQLPSSLAQRPKGPGREIGRQSRVNLLKKTAEGGSFSGNISFNTAGICCHWPQRRALGQGAPASRKPSPFLQESSSPPSSRVASSALGEAGVADLSLGTGKAQRFFRSQLKVKVVGLIKLGSSEVPLFSVEARARPSAADPKARRTEPENAREWNQTFSKAQCPTRS